MNLIINNKIPHILKAQNNIKYFNYTNNTKEALVKMEAKTLVKRMSEKNC